MQLFRVVYLSNRPLWLVSMADKPLGMLEEHSKNSQIIRLRLVIYEFFPCSSKIQSGLSALKPWKLVVYCFYTIIQKTRALFHEFTGTINHS